MVYLAKQNSNGRGCIKSGCIRHATDVAAECAQKVAETNTYAYQMAVHVCCLMPKGLRLQVLPAQGNGTPLVFQTFEGYWGGDRVGGHTTKG